MIEPTEILPMGCRVRTHATLGSTSGLFITDRHLNQRKPDTAGAICGIVPGHGGDVYYVAHLGDTAMAAYGWMEFDLEPAPEPACTVCEGSGFDWPTSSAQSLATACHACQGTGTSLPGDPGAAFWSRLVRD